MAHGWEGLPTNRKQSRDCHHVEIVVEKLVDSRVPGRPRNLHHSTERRSI
jgi:hypothetical protein